MCGIVGIFNFVNDKNRIVSREQQAFIVNMILTEALYHTEKRGKDATGYYAAFRNGEGIGLKDSKKSTKFIFEGNKDPKMCYRDHARVLETYHNEVSPVSAVIGHCRASSVGSIYNNDNNHPIVIDERFVGIHNGTLSNHRLIEKNIADKIERVGDVDSELLVQLAKIWKMDNNASFDHSTCEWIGSRVEGPCVTFIVDRNDPTKVMWLKQVRPLIFYYIKEAGLLVAISETSIFDKIVEEYSKLMGIYNVDIPEITFNYTTIYDNNCGIINTDAVIDETDERISAKFIEDAIDAKKMVTSKVNGFFEDKYNNPYSSNTTNRRNNNYNNNNNSYHNSSHTEHKASNTDKSNKSMPPALTGNNDKDNTNSNTVDATYDELITVKKYDYVIGKFIEVKDVKKDKVIPNVGSNKNKKIDKDRPWPDSLEAIRPFRNVSSPYGAETAIRLALDKPYKSLNSMKPFDIITDVEKICMLKVGNLVASLEEGLKKTTKARRNILAAKKFINAILPLVVANTDNINKVWEVLSEDEAEFIKKLIRPSTVADSCLAMEEYVNKLSTGAKNYA